MTEIPLTKYMTKPEAKHQQKNAQGFLLNYFGITKQINELHINFGAEMILGKIYMRLSHHQTFSKTNTEISRELSGILKPKDINQYLLHFQHQKLITVHFNKPNDKYYQKSLPLGRRIITNLNLKESEY